MQLGHLVLPNPWILAPMAGVSEQPFREIALALGAGAAPTELVSANGLIRASARTAKYLKHGPSEKPFIVQIFGGEPEVMAEAAIRVRDVGADAIDINMGCPVPKVTKSGAGSGLLCDPPRAAEIVRRVKAASGLPVSVKIRTGWDANRLNFVEMGQAMQEAGACAIAMHGRTRAQGYAGKANWQHIAKLKQSVQIPVIGNGDVVTVADAFRMRDETGCDAVMIGRAALGNPWLFRQILGGEPPAPEERRDLVLAHFDAHRAFLGHDLSTVRTFRRHFGWYSHGLGGSASFRSAINKLEDFGEARALADRYFSDAGRDFDLGSVDDADVDYRAAYG